MCFFKFINYSHIFEVFCLNYQENMKIGSHVVVLDEDIKGHIVQTKNDIVTIETEDGFIMDFKKKELLIIDSKISNYEMSQMNFDEVILDKGDFKKQQKKIRPKKKNQPPPMEVDLHIGQLVKSTKFMENHDMLNIQIDTAQNKLEYAIDNRIQRIVFIHGIGEGVLRASLESLFRRYDNLAYYDADYQKYGRGATEVYIFQSANRDNE